MRIEDTEVISTVQVKQQVKNKIQSCIRVKSELYSVFQLAKTLNRKHFASAVLEL